MYWVQSGSEVFDQQTISVQVEYRETAQVEVCQASVTKKIRQADQSQESVRVVHEEEERVIVLECGTPRDAAIWQST